MSVPERYDLTAEQLDAATRLAGISAAPGSLLAATGSSGDPRTALSGTSALDSSGALAAGLRSGLEVLQGPQHALVAAVQQVGEQTVSLATFVGGQPGDPTVLVTRPEGGLSLLVLPSPTWSLIALDDALGLSDLPTLPTDYPVDLSALGLLTLAAVSDVLMAGELTATLRREQPASVVVRAADCESMLAQGGASTDTRWSVAAVGSLVPVPVLTFTGRMAEGLSELVSAGLATPVSDGVSPTPVGAGLVAALQRTIRTAVLSVVIGAASADGRGPVAASAGVLRCSAEILLVRWDGQTGDRARAVVGRVDASDALDLLDGLLHPVAPPPEAITMPAPPAPVPAPEPTVPAPGAVPAQSAWPQAAPADAPSPAAPASVAPAGTAWVPTHAVPGTGLDAFADPDPAASPVARLDPALLVVVDQAWGVWFHIVCENGWTAWVDGRLLMPLR